MIESLSLNHTPRCPDQGITRHGEERRVGGGREGGECSGGTPALMWLPPPCHLPGGPPVACPATGAHPTVTVPASRPGTETLYPLVPWAGGAWPGQWQEKGFEGLLSLGKVSSHRYGRLLCLSHTLYPSLAVHRAAWTKGLHFPASLGAECGHMTQFLPMG